MTSERIGFIGLGIMGKPMAHHLLQAGFSLTVFNRSKESARELAQMGARIGTSLVDVVKTSDILITMLPDPETIEEVYFGPQGILSAIRAEQVCVDMSTSSPELAQRIAGTCKLSGAESVDAPVSGGEVGAQEATLSIMAGGSRSAFERVLPVLRVVGRNVVHVGDSGAGQITKACNQVVVALTIEAVGEAMALAAQAGVDPWKVREALLGGFAQSRVLDLHGERALAENFQPGARVSLHHKDLAIALKTATRLGVSLPSTLLVKEMMDNLIARGDGDLDHSILIAYVRELSQLHR